MFGKMLILMAILLTVTTVVGTTLLSQGLVLGSPIDLVNKEPLFTPNDVKDDPGFPMDIPDPEYSNPWGNPWSDFSSVDPVITWQEYGTESEPCYSYVEEICPTDGTILWDPYPTKLEEPPRTVSLDKTYSGPEFAISSLKPHVVMTRWDDTDSVMQIASFSLTNSAWSLDDIPGINPWKPNAYLDRWAPFCSFNTNDSDPTVVFLKPHYIEGEWKTLPTWKYLNGGWEQKIEWGSSAAVGMGRWVQNDILNDPSPTPFRGLIGIKEHGGPGTTFQVFLMDVRDVITGNEDPYEVRLTYEIEDEQYNMGDAFMWKDPDPGNMGYDFLFCCTYQDSVNPTCRGLIIFKCEYKSHLDYTVSELWRFNKDTHPRLPFNWIISPEPFVVGTNSYISFMVSNWHTINEDPQIPRDRTQIWMAKATDADSQSWGSHQDGLRRLSGISPVIRRDPEPFVGPNDAWVYYTEWEVLGSDHKNEYRRVPHRCDTGAVAFP